MNLTDVQMVCLCLTKICKETTPYTSKHIKNNLKNTPN